MMTITITRILVGLVVFSSITFAQQDTKAGPNTSRIRYPMLAARSGTQGSVRVEVPNGWPELEVKGELVLVQEVVNHLAVDDFLDWKKSGITRVTYVFVLSDAAKVPNSEGGMNSLRLASIVQATRTGESLIITITAKQPQGHVNVNERN